jgi:hypothetical protein
MLYKNEKEVFIKNSGHRLVKENTLQDQEELLH